MHYSKIFLLGGSRGRIGFVFREWAGLLLAATFIFSISGPAFVFAIDTGFLSPTAETRNFGHGDDKAFSDDTNKTDATNGEIIQYYDYGFSIPTSSTINGISVRLDAWRDSDATSGSFAVELSRNGGSTFTSSGKSTGLLTTTETTYTLGGASDIWGGAWSSADFSNANFRVRVTATTNPTNKKIKLDWIPVKVYYSTPTGTITIIKDTVPDDAQDFSFTTTGSGLSSFSLDDDANATLLNTKTFTGLTAGAYAVTEAAVAGFDLTGLSCVDPTSNSSGNTGTRVASINIASGETVTCTFTNTKIPKLTVTKVVVNNNGGTKVVSDFSLLVGATGVTSGVQNGFNTGIYTVSETGDSGYDAVISGDCAANGSIILAPGDIKSCTITNDDKPAHIIVVKHVINDDGGAKVASDFSMVINSVTAVGGNTFSGVESAGTDKTLSTIGAYSVTEDAFAGYAESSSADCSGTIALGETKTCTITNDDIAPTIKVFKTVVNDNGGSTVANNFSFLLDSIISLVHNVATPTNAGVHAVSEDSFFGYTPSVWGGACNSDGLITLALDQDATCTIMNDDIAPTLTLEKTVVTLDGGTATEADFQGKIDGNNVAWDVANVLLVGNHTASEVAGVSGYAASLWGGDCATDGTITLVPGQNATCTVTNDDIAPGLTLKKVVTTNNGGTEDDSDFQGYIDDDPVDWNDAQTLSAGTYTLTEDSLSSYQASDWSCVGGSLNGNEVIIGLEETVVCTITNDDIAPTLTLVKEVTNNNGGTAVASDWTLTAIGISTISGEGGAESGSNFQSGTYTLSEAATDSESNMTEEYTAGNWSCTNDVTVSEDNQITLGIGQSTTCTIMNDDKPGTISGIKYEDNNGNGARDEGEPGPGGWTIYLDANDNGLLDEEETSVTTDESGAYQFNNLSAGTYNIKEVLKDGWKKTEPSANQYMVKLSQGSAIIDKDFGNFKLVTITGYKWDDKNGDGVWQKSCEEEGCVAEPGLKDVVVALGRQNGDPIEKNGHETIPIEIIAMDLTGAQGDFVFSNVGRGNYKLFEEKKTGWSATNPALRADSFFDITYNLGAIGDPDFDLLRVTGDPDFNLLRDSFFDVFAEFSGQEVNQSNVTQGLITTIPSVPLEFGNHKLLVITEEAETAVEQTSTVITWVTDFPGTSRVVYDTVSHPVLGSAPNYGYANSTAIFDESPKVPNHSVSIGGLVAGTTYYYRTISAASPESVGSEGSFGTSAPSSSGGGSGGSSGGGGGGGGIVILPGTSGPASGSGSPSGGEVLGAFLASLPSVPSASSGGSSAPVEPTQVSASAPTDTSGGAVAGETIAQPVSESVVDDFVLPPTSHVSEEAAIVFGLGMWNWATLLLVILAILFVVWYSRRDAIRKR